MLAFLRHLMVFLLGAIVGAGSTVQIRVGRRSYGPFAADGSGVAHVTFDVLPGEPMPAYQIRGGAHFAPGMRLTQDEGEVRTLLSLRPDAWLADQGVKAGESFKLVGFLTVDRDGEFGCRGAFPEQP